jgi:hypothetical protein
LPERKAAHPTTLDSQVSGDGGGRHQPGQIYLSQSVTVVGSAAEKLLGKRTEISFVYVPWPLLLLFKYAKRLGDGRYRRALGGQTLSGCH